MTNLSKREIYFIIGLFLLLFSTITFAYAYFSSVITGEGKDNLVETGTLSILFEDGPEIVLNKAFPGDSITKTFKVTNTGTLDTTYDITWSELINTIENDELTYSLFLGENEISSGIVPTESEVMQTMSIVSEEVHEFTLTITFIETGENQNYNQNKLFSSILQINEAGHSGDIKLSLKFNGQVVSSLPEEGYFKLASYTCKNGSTISYNPISGKITTYSDETNESCTLEFEEADTLIERMTSDNEVLDDSSIDFGAISSDTNGRGLYRTSNLDRNEDIDGDGIGEEVLYFRGVVENNYVIFADHCWRVVRTNEDGSVKIRYGGEPTSGTCPQTGTNVGINDNATYAFNSAQNAAQYVGYTYGTSNTDSVAKSTVETWYENNIANQGDDVTSLIVDVPYCNDRSISTIPSPTSGYTYYGAIGRLHSTITTMVPQYKCPQETDKYTLKTENGGTSGYGNNLLEYPVGLLTADEISFAGGSNRSANQTFYLHIGANYWTMSPFWYSGSAAYVFFVYIDSGLVYNPVTAENGLVPVVSLNVEAVVVKGTGVYNDPYVIG